LIISIGFWDPHELNEVSDFYDQRGLNSLQILQMLSSAWLLTKNPKYMNAIEELGKKYEYFINIINQVGYIYAIVLSIYQIGVSDDVT
jgi:hypothetical protein